MTDHLPIPSVHWRDDLALAWDTPRRWQIIRDYYTAIAEEISRGDRIDPYALGLDRFLTPIERLVWCDIREIGLPFFMQYPVGSRFVDFADPVRRIAIEADGAAYHDAERDAAKNAELHRLGWTVYRFSGSDIYRDKDSSIIRDLATLYGRRIRCEREDD